MPSGRLSKAIASFLLLAAGAPGNAIADDHCPNGVSTVTVEPHVGEYPVYISQYFDQDTTIIINGGITIDITNAPTFISTVATATVTTTVTVSGPTTASATPTTDTFALQVLPLGPAGLKARQEPVDCVEAGDVAFLGPNGFLVDSIADAEQWFLANGSLVSARSGTPMSIDAGLAEIPFAVSPVIGFITQTFALGGNQITWTNDAFSGGAARFFYRAASRALFIDFNGITPQDGEEAFPYPVDPFNFQAASTCVSTTASASSTESSTSTESATSLNITSSIESTATTSSDLVTSETSETSSSESVSSTDISSSATETSSTEPVSETSTSSESSTESASSTESSTESASSTESSTESASSTESSTESSSSSVGTTSVITTSATSTNTTSAPTTTPTSDTCGAPDQACANAQVSSQAGTLIETLSNLGASAADVVDLADAADGSLGGLASAAQLPAALTGLITSIGSAGTSFGSASPLDAGCDADAFAIAVNDMLTSFETLADALKARASILNAVPVLNGVIPDFLTQLGTGISALSGPAQTIAPSRACFLQTAFDNFAADLASA